MMTHKKTLCLSRHITTIFLLIGLLAFGHLSHGQCTKEIFHVNNISELTAKVTYANANTNNHIEIILKNGTYNLDVINETWIDDITRVSDCKLIIRAETRGLATVIGTVFLKFNNAKNCSLDGINFIRTGRYSTRAIEFLQTEHCGIYGCSFTEDPEANLSGTNYYIHLTSGFKTTIDHCIFKDKFSAGHIINMTSMKEGENQNHHTISNNFFGPYALKGGKWSFMKLGGCGIPASDTGHIMANFTIEGNFFDSYGFDDLESAYSEIISLKCSGNTIRKNWFYNCRGSLVLRCSASNFISSNYFIATEENIPRNRGIRVSGPDHIIVNNYFQSLNSIPIEILAGSGDFNPNPSVENPNPTYYNTKNCYIIFNTLVNCPPWLFNFYIGSTPFMPEENNIHNNILYSPDDDHSVFISVDPEIDPLDYQIPWLTNNFEHNIYYSNILSQLTPDEFMISPLSNNFNLDPQMIDYLYFKIPGPDSYAIDNCFQGDFTNYPRIDWINNKRDIFKKDIGCHERVIYKNKTPNLNSRSEQNSLKIFPNPFESSINIKLKKGDNIDIIDNQGRIVFTKEIITTDTHHIDLSSLANGLYFVRLNNQVLQSIIKQ